MTVLALLYGLFSFIAGICLGSRLHPLLRVVAAAAWFAPTLALFLRTWSIGLLTLRITELSYGLIGVGCGYWAISSLPPDRRRILLGFVAGYVAGLFFCGVGAVLGAVIGVAIADRR